MVTILYVTARPAMTFKRIAEWISECWYLSWLLDFLTRNTTVRQARLLKWLRFESFQLNLPSVYKVFINKVGTKSSFRFVVDMHWKFHRDFRWLVTLHQTPRIFFEKSQHNLWIPILFDSLKAHILSKHFTLLYQTS